MDNKEEKQPKSERQRFSEPTICPRCHGSGVQTWSNETMYWTEEDYWENDEYSVQTDNLSMCEYCDGEGVLWKN